MSELNTSESSLIKKDWFEAVKNKTSLFLKNFLKDKYNLIFLGILILAILIRLKYLTQESIWNDSAVHLWYSIRVIEHPSFFFTAEYIGGDYFTIQTLTAIFYFFTKNILLSGQITAFIFSLLGIVFMYLLGREIQSGFFGLVASALLAFNHLFWFYNVRPLADGPLTALVPVAFYFVLKLEKNPQWKWSIATIISFFALMLTKGAGALFFIIYLIYLLIFRRQNAIKNKFLLLSWLFPVIVISLGSIIFKKNFVGVLVSRFLDAVGLQYAGLNALKMLPWVSSWYIFIPALLGILLIIIYRHKEYYFPLVSVILYWFYFEIGVGTPEDRYLMPIFPLIILLFIFTLSELGSYITMLVKNKYVSIAIIVFFIVFISWQSYAQGDQLISQKTYTYTGYVEAAQWLNDNVPKGTPIFAGSPRTMRGLMGREFAGPGEWALGGSIWYLRSAEYREGKQFFEKDLAQLIKTNDVYLEIDVWEYTQPSWYFPLSQESLNYFMGLWFYPVKVVERDVPTQDGLKKMPVVFILRKDKILNLTGATAVNSS